MTLASDSEAAEVEVEYDLEVEGSSNLSEHETSDDEPDAYANEARWQTRNGWLNMKRKEKWRKN